jgi:hypothetical protein
VHEPNATLPTNLDFLVQMGNHWRGVLPRDLELRIFKHRSAGAIDICNLRIQFVDWMDAVSQ